MDKAQKGKVLTRREVIQDMFGAGVAAILPSSVYSELKSTGATKPWAEAVPANPQRTTAF